MSVAKAYKHLIGRCKLEHDCDDVNVTRRGFTLIELVLVLMILAILAGAAMSMVDTQVDQARFESTQQTLLNIENAVLGPDNARAADGSRAVSGFVADCGRLPYSLEELYIRPTSIPNFDFTVPVDDDAAPTGNELSGDRKVTAFGGWNGPYLRLPIGSASLPDGWAASFLAYQSNGVASNAETPLAVLLSLGRDNLPLGSGYDTDLSLVFNSITPAVDVATPEGEVKQVPVPVQNRWQKSFAVNVSYNNLSTNPDTQNGNTIVVRVYGPVTDPVDSTGQVIRLGTIQEKIKPYTADESVSVTFTNVPIGPRIIRAYQLNAAPNDPEDDLLNTENDEPGETLEAISLPTRVVVSRETSLIELILKDMPE